MSAGRASAVALLLVVLALPAAGQEPAPAPSPSFSLGAAFPNPFERETRLPFVLEDALFRDGRRPLVSIHVYNLLHQLVGFASLEGEGGGRRRLDRSPFERPGRYEAVWDGRDLRGGRVTEGPYFLQMSVDGRTQVRKVLVVR